MVMGYDGMGRPVSMTDPAGDPGTYGSYAPTNWVSGVQYDYAGRQTNLSWLAGLATGYSSNSASESRTYNVNGQLASIGWNGSNAPLAQIQYVYPATQNNGQIAQEVDSYPYGVGVTTASYQYDALRRLTSAATTQTGNSGVTPWTQTYQYDGFGNLTAKVLNGISTPISVNAATNQLTNAYYDANGNMTSGAGATLTYDEANRVSTVTETAGGQAFYGYDPSNRRIYQRGSAPGGETFTFYGAKGENLGRYSINTSSCYPYAFCFVPQMTNLWFGGRLVATTNYSGNAPMVFQDRLGTNRNSGARYYPYGEEITSTPNDAVKFATYTRDSYTGLDYAMNRYYASAYGRFNTPDPGRSARRRNPSSWNRYSYTRGDPVNRNDPKGLCDDLVAGINQFSPGADALNQFATTIGANQAYPYADGDRSSLIASVFSGLTEVAMQGLLSADSSTFAAWMSVMASANDPGPINIYTYSGGAQAFASAYPYLPSSVQNRINNVTYISPGTGGTTLPSGSGTTTVILGNGPTDSFAGIATSLPSGSNIIDVDCRHDATCEFQAAQAALLQNAGNACSTPSTFSTAPGNIVTQVTSTINYDNYWWNDSWNDYWTDFFGASPNYGKSIPYLFED